MLYFQYYQAIVRHNSQLSQQSSSKTSYNVSIQIHLREDLATSSTNSITKVNQSQIL